jgi:hypothetical protein
MDKGLVEGLSLEGATKVQVASKIVLQCVVYGGFHKCFEQLLG